MWGPIEDILRGGGGPVFMIRYGTMYMTKHDKVAVWSKSPKVE